MDTFSRNTFFVFLFLIAITVIATYWRIMIQKDFIIDEENNSTLEILNPAPTGSQ